MGRLSNSISINDENAITTDSTIKTTQSDYGVYIFVDENGNVTQINKEKKERLKFYPDQINAPLIEPCVIGISGDIGVENCTEGIAMGCGDIGSNTEMAYAIY